MSTETMIVLSASSSSSASSPDSNVADPSSSETPVNGSRNGTSMVVNSESDTSQFAWPNLERYAKGFRSFLNGQRSLFIMAHPELMFSQPKYLKATKAEYERMERGTLTLMCAMVNETFLDISQYSLQEKKDILHGFSMESGNLYSAYLTAKAFPGGPKTLWVSHYGYFMDERVVRQFFADANTPTAEENVRLVMTTTDKYLPLVRACERLQLSDIEIGALTALQFFTTMERLSKHAEEMRVRKDIVFDELNQYLVTTYGVRSAGVRMGRLCCLWNDVEKFSTYMHEYQLIEKLFLSGSMCEIWEDILDSHVRTAEAISRLSI